VSEIDWNIELRKIEREYDGLPPEPPQLPKRRSPKTEFRLERIQEIATKYEFYDRLAVIGVWTRLVLIATLTVSLFWWPYGRDCGFPLVAFLVSNAMAIVGGTSLAVRTRRDRMLWPFVASALVITVASSVIAMHALPRLGYSPDGVTAAGWSCASSP
jgi:hypothetical protein